MSRGAGIVARATWDDGNDVHRVDPETPYFQRLQPEVAKVQAKGGGAATVPAATLGPSKNLGGAI